MSSSSSLFFDKLIKFWGISNYRLAQSIFTFQCPENWFKTPALRAFFKKYSIVSKKWKKTFLLQSFCIRVPGNFLRLRTKLNLKMCQKIASLNLRTNLIFLIGMVSKEGTFNFLLKVKNIFWQEKAVGWILPERQSFLKS